MTKSTYTRKRRELLARLKKTHAELLALEHEPIEVMVRPAQNRIPQWCKPWWERRDGNQHIVYCTATKNGIKRTGWWLWCDGRAKVMSDSIENAKALARIRFCYDTLIWDVEQWDKYVKEHPAITDKLKELKG